MRLIFVSAVFATFVTASYATSEDDDESSPKLYTINGKVHPPAVHNSVPSDPDWFWRTKVVVDGGKREERFGNMPGFKMLLKSILRRVQNMTEFCILRSDAMVSFIQCRTFPGVAFCARMARSPCLGCPPGLT